MHSAISTRIAALALAVIVLPTVGAAQTYEVRKLPPKSEKGYDEIHISKAALAGQQIQVWGAWVLNPDCTAAGTMTTEIVDHPRHGKASISEDPSYPNFAPPNPRAACNSVKSPGKQAFYTSEAGFRGRDKFVLQNATSGGRIRRIIIDVEVR